MSFNKNNNIKNYEALAINIKNTLKDENLLVFTSSNDISIYNAVVNIKNVLNKLNKRTLIINVSRESTKKHIDTTSTDLDEISYKAILEKDFKNQIQLIKDRHDYIFFTTDSINKSSDALILLDLIKNVVLIEKINKSKNQNIDYAIQNIKQLTAKIHGFILI